MLPIYTALVVAYLFLPIAAMIVFGFNDIKGSLQLHLEGFHARALAEHLQQLPGAERAAIKVSLLVGASRPSSPPRSGP